MRVTDRLKVEHGVFLRQLRMLEDLLDEGASADLVRGAVTMIAGAEHHHSQLEDRVLYPALAKVVGNGSQALQAVADDHQKLQELSARVLETLVTNLQHRPFDAEAVRSYIRLTREHLEREIHGTFALAEELIPDGELASMASWHADHVFEEAGRPAPWSTPKA